MYQYMIIHLKMLKGPTLLGLVNFRDTLWEDTTVFDEEFKDHGEKIVLFLGRITLQKGPDYFLDAAKKVLEKDRNIKFIVAGSGDMEPFIIEKAAHYCARCLKASALSYLLKGEIV